MMQAPALALTEDDRKRIERCEELARAGDDGVAPLVEALADPSWVVRRAVIAALSRMGDVAVPALTRALVTDRSDETRIAANVDALAASRGNDVARAMIDLLGTSEPAVLCDALQVLGRRRVEESVARVAVLSDHADDNVAVAAIEALGRIGGVETVEPLIAAVRSENFFRTFPAMDALGRTGDARAVEPLAALLNDSFYSAEAARALGHTAQEAAVAPLAALLTKPMDTLVRVAAGALANLRERHEARFGDSPSMNASLPATVKANVASTRLLASTIGAGPSELVAMARVFAWIADETSFNALIDLTDSDDPVGAAAIEALRAAGKLAAPYLLSALAAETSARRAKLLPIIAFGRGQTAGVLACLEDPDPSVRVQACEALARLGDTTAVAALFRLIGDGDARVSQAAAGAIQSLGSSETKRLSLEQARSSDPRTRRASLRILAYFGYPEAREILVEAALDDDDKIREPSIAGLAMLDDPRALEALLRVAVHPLPRTRAAGMRALGQTNKSPEVAAALTAGVADDDAWVRYYACQAIGRLRLAAATEALIERLVDPAGQVRVAAIEALAHIGNEAAQAALDRAAESDDPDMTRAALVGLGIGRHPASLSRLLRAIEAPDAATRLVAISALAQFDEPEVVAAFARAMNDRDDGVRGAAIGYLSTRTGMDATRALVDRIADSALRGRIIAALAVAPEARIDGILAALESAHEETASALVSALGRMRHPSAQAALAAVLHLDNAMARRAAASALAALGTREALETLERIATRDPDGEVRRISLAAAAGAAVSPLASAHRSIG